MGRRLGAVDEAAPPRLRALAVFLREVKADQDVTFALMARHNKPSAGGASTFIAAGSGSRLPTHGTVRAYLDAAWAARAAVAAREGRAADGYGIVPQALVERADRLWFVAHLERAFAGGERPPYPEPERVKRAEQLAEAVKTLYQRAGSPPLKFVELRTDAAGCQVARATVELVLDGRLQPARGQLAALLQAFGLTKRSVAAWLAAWDRVQARLVVRSERARAYAGLVSCADSDPKVQAWRQQREQQEELLRKMGKLRPDEDYDDWLERKERALWSRSWMDWLSEEESAG